MAESGPTRGCHKAGRSVDFDVHYRPHKPSDRATDPPAAVDPCAIDIPPHTTPAEDAQCTRGRVPPPSPPSIPTPHETKKSDPARPGLVVVLSA